MKYVITPAYYTFHPETDFERKVLGYFALNFCETRQPDSMVGGALLNDQNEGACCPDCKSKDISFCDGKCKCNVCMREFDTGQSLG